MFFTGKVQAKPFACPSRTLDNKKYKKALKLYVKELVSHIKHCWLVNFDLIVLFVLLLYLDDINIKW